MTYSDYLYTPETCGHSAAHPDERTVPHVSIRLTPPAATCCRGYGDDIEPAEQQSVRSR